MLTDRDTLDRFRHGDRQVLTRLFHCHAPDIARLARYGFAFRSQDEMRHFRGFTDIEAQENLIQETFVRAFSEEARQRYDGITPYAAYLKRVAKNIAIDELRRRGWQRLQRVDLESLDHAEGSSRDEPSAEQRLHQQQLAQAVQKFLRTLSDEERRFISLRYEQGLSQEEVASGLEVGRRTVRTLERRVRAALHRSLRTSGLIEPLKTARFSMGLLHLFSLLGGGR